MLKNNNKCYSVGTPRYEQSHNVIEMPTKKTVKNIKFLWKPYNLGVQMTKKISQLHLMMCQLWDVQDCSWET